MKLKLHQILFASIKTYELEERIRREDFSFDAFAHLGQLLGYKHPSVLRKMCEHRSVGSNSAKLGVEDAMAIMTEINDYRLLDYIREELKDRKRVNGQLSLFSQPNRQL